MSTLIKQHLASARKVMKACGIDALYVPTMDPHRTEYLPEHWALRSYLSTFHGSAGTLVITQKKAALWTDFRYWIEADLLLRNSEISLMCMGKEGVPSVNSFLKKELNEGSVVGFDPEMMMKTTETSMSQDLLKAGISLKGVSSLTDQLWLDRPTIGHSQIVEFPTKFSGVSREKKLKKLKEDMKKIGANAYLVSSLYDIAWLFNLRGDDTPCTPIFIAYSLVTDTSTTLFADRDRFSPSLLRKLEKEGIAICDYADVCTVLKKLPEQTRLFAPEDSTCVALSQSIAKKIIKVTCDKNPITEAKSIKNKVELAHLREAMIFDGVALTRFFCELENALKNGEAITEHDASLMLDHARSEMPLNKGISFSSIVAYGANGAMCHYHPEESQKIYLKQEGSLLIDSGGQYLLGTTDITRTVALGKVSRQYKQDYTFVLKGHLAISRAIFPKGTKGGQIDILARQFMWAHGIEFNHGTGHGIGFYLNVHEGPCGIAGSSNAVLQVGQCITNEPGIYREGEYGIRIENVVCVEKCKTTPFASFLGFEDLTLYPYDLNSINISLLTQEEIDHINYYHQCVFRLLSPFLTSIEKRFLKRLTREIK